MSAGTLSILWSPGQVSTIDSKGIAHTASGLSSLAKDLDLRSAVILIAHRNSLIRTTKVPNLKRSQLEPLVRAKTNALFPGGTQGYSFGFRAGGDPEGEGKIAIVGGTKTETLRRIHAEAQAAGIKVLAVLPAAFGAWIASTDHHLRDGIVVSREGADTCLNVISGGELTYSRFTQSGTTDELLEEIEATLQTAGVAKGLVLTLGKADLPGAQNDPREPSTFMSDLGLINRSLFTLDLPELTAKREKRKLYAAAQRGAALLAITAAAWTFVILKHQRDVFMADKSARIEKALNLGEKQKLSAIASQTTDLRQKEHILNVAFDPAQTFSDMVAVLGQDSGKAWLTGLSMERGGMISIRGDAQDQKTISAYFHKLRNEPRFRDVQLRSTTKGQLNNVTIYQFAISAWAVGNVPFDQYVEPTSE